MSDELRVGGQGLGNIKGKGASSVKVPKLWTGDYYNEGVGSSHDGLFDKLREECGVFGVFGHSEAASLSYYACMLSSIAARRVRESA